MDNNIPTYLQHRAWDRMPRRLFAAFRSSTDATHILCF